MAKDRQNAHNQSSTQRHAWPQSKVATLTPSRKGLWQRTHISDRKTDGTDGTAEAASGAAASGRRCWPIICPICEPTISWTDWANQFCPPRNGTCCRTPFSTCVSPCTGWLLASKAPSPMITAEDMIGTKRAGPVGLCCANASSSGAINLCSAPIAIPVITFTPGVKVAKFGPSTAPSVKGASPVMGASTISGVSVKSSASVASSREATSLGTVILAADSLGWYLHVSVINLRNSGGIRWIHQRHVPMYSVYHILSISINLHTSHLLLTSSSTFLRLLSNRLPGHRFNKAARRGRRCAIARSAAAASGNDMIQTATAFAGSNN